MPMNYYLSEKDLKIATDILKNENIAFEIISSEKSTNYPILLLPLEDNETLVTISSLTNLDNISKIKELNEKRNLYKNKLEKSKKAFASGNFCAVISAFLIILSVGSAFFSVGFGNNVHLGFYAFFILTIVLLVLTFFLLKKGAKDYEEGRRYINVAKQYFKK